jgi:hypothetical protein
MVNTPEPAPRRGRDELIAEARATTRAIGRVRRDRRLREGKAKPRTYREMALFGTHLDDPAGARALEHTELRAAISGR